MGTRLDPSIKKRKSEFRPLLIGRIRFNSLTIYDFRLPKAGPVTACHDRFMELDPRHRFPWPKPAGWPAVLEACLKAGALLLEDGGTGEGFLAWTGPTLVSRWQGCRWESRLEGKRLDASPWGALEAALGTQPGPWVGAATYEVCCDEAELPRRAVEVGALGQAWRGVREGLYWKGDAFEWLSWEPQAPVLQLLEQRLAPAPAGIPKPPPGPSMALTCHWSEAVHRQAVEAIQARILEGGFYVANLCVPFRGLLAGAVEPLALAALERARPPFGAILQLEECRLLSLSMERLLARRGGRLWSQPIKGSVPLLGNAAQDDLAALALAGDPKEVAEHTMILDLVRNDLGRVALPGSVRVSRPMAVEAFPTVQHLVSTVEAEAIPGLRLPGLLRSILPGGSVTGAPKHAVCGHLAAAEAAPRGFYCGALGWVSPTGNLDLALPIRTAQIIGRQVTYWTGGGITRRSDARKEWQELHLKTRAMIG